MTHGQRCITLHSAERGIICYECKAPMTNDEPYWWDDDGEEYFHPACQIMRCERAIEAYVEFIVGRDLWFDYVAHLGRTATKGDYQWLRAKSISCSDTTKASA